MPQTPAPVPRKPREHPSTRKLIQAVAQRWDTLRKRHTHAEQAMWLGMLAQHFDDAELALLSDRIPVFYRDRLAAAGRRVQWLKPNEWHHV